MTSQKHLIVVDDEADFRALVAQCADALGYRVTELADSRLFESTLEEARPDAVVIDMMMPYRDGFDLMDVVAGLDPRLKVIFVTGHIPLYAQSAVDHLAALGFKDLWTLGKPFKLSELRQALTPAEASSGSG